jgi:hypothetical protein
VFRCAKPGSGDPRGHRHPHLRDRHPDRDGHLQSRGCHACRCLFAEPLTDDDDENGIANLLGSCRLNSSNGGKQTNPDARRYQTQVTLSGDRAVRARAGLRHGANE